MKAAVFLGPSLSLEEARKITTAEILPPVKSGNFTRVLQYKPKVIGIVDGYFDSIPAVWHKEILLALTQGIHVVGGASMGALRAAELHTFGMEGVGEIFEWYRDGVIDADDEVAVVHTTAENDYRSFSDPMVNIRKTLSQAATDGIINRLTLDTLIEIAHQTFYKKRTYRQLLADGLTAGIAPESIHALEVYLHEHKIDLKKLDAIKVLERVEELMHTDQPPSVNFELAQTTYFRVMFDHHQVVDTHMDQSIDILDLTNHARLEWEDYQEFRLRAFTNLLFLQYAAQNGTTLSAEEIEDGKEDFLNYLGITEDQIEDWIVRNRIPPDQFEQYMQDWLLLRKVKNQASLIDNRTLLWQARLENKFESLLSDVKDTLTKANLADSQWNGDVLTSDILFEYFKDKMQLDQTVDMMDFAYDLGFRDKQTLILSLLRSYLANNSKPSEK